MAGVGEDRRSDKRGPAQRWLQSRRLTHDCRCAKRHAGNAFQQPQQTGVLLNIRQQVQPALIIEVMHAQQASIMAQHAGSPLVHVTHTPSSVGSHLHIAMTRLQQHATMPFIMQQQLHRAPGIIVQRFWSMVAETLSSHAQTIFIPPAHFLNVIVQRGTINTFMPVGCAPARSGAHSDSTRACPEFPLRLVPS